MQFSLTTAVGFAGAVLAFASVIPQALKLVRLPSAAGVSVAALANSTISGLAWTGFGVAQHDIWVALPALLTVPATAAALALAWIRGGARDRLWLPIAWTAALVFAATSTAWLGTRPLTLALGLSIALMVAPAAATAWRSHDVSAVAAPAWLLLIAEALLTGAYGALAGINANLLYAVVAISGSVVVLIRVAIPTHVHTRFVPLPLSAPERVEPLGQDRLELAS